MNILVFKGCMDFEFVGLDGIGYRVIFYILILRILFYGIIFYFVRLEILLDRIRGKFL